MANQIHDAFDNIRADAGLKESTMKFLSQQRRERMSPSRRPKPGKMLVTACILLFFAVGLGGYSWIHTPVSYVSIDVNPSVELVLNRIDRVVDITPFNADGAALVEGLSLKGKKYTDAVNLIVEGAAMEGYLLDDAELVFTVAASGIRSDELKAGIEQCHSFVEHRCYSASADIGQVLEAHEQGLSLGKYHAYLELSSYDDTVTVDDCREMSMAEIHQCIRSHGGHGGDILHGEENPLEGEEYGGSDSENSDNGADDDGAEASGSTSHHGGHGHHGEAHE